jgi:regulator of replication initiation timing
MQASKRFGLILVVSLLTILPSGCSAPQEQTGAIGADGSLHGSSSGSIDPQDSSIVKRFQDASPQSRTAVESAMELLEKHAELSKQAAELEKKNHSLIAENSQLKSQVSSLEPDLKQTQKELTEANDLLVEMRIELNNWKTSILGFRDEMRQADIAQLETLLKILKILGGEVTVQSAQGRQSDDRSPTSASARQPGQLAPASPDASQGGGVKVQEARAPGENNG